ncbi:hypothetical protein GP486_003320 [Trichoglossum hirsutum]|uniref:G domain-containing protein n=1 Tax=Trichoglossum hirsutum TaxID=265104 RepID=A0A9P8RQT4_9PEZI|nr:hypothetical protein GP486_003320 [Trichoglossum hirsutum]
MNGLTQRPAFGQIAAIGTFYDARSDSFLPRSLFNKELLPEGVSQTNIQGKAVQISYADSYEENFKAMGVGAELGGSILAGFVVPGGSGRYLVEKRESGQILQSAIHHRITTVQEKLNLGSNEAREHLSFSLLQSSEVTHIVTEIKWGAQSVVMARCQSPSAIGRSSHERQFQAEVEAFKSAIEGGHPANHENAAESGGTDLPLEITAFSDVLADEGVIMRDFREAYDFLDIMPVCIRDENGGKGKPIVYTLLPIAMLALFLPIEIKDDVTSIPPSAECLSRFVQLLDEFSTFRRELNDHQAYAMDHKLYMPEGHAQGISGRIRRVKTTEMILKSKYARVLQDVRNGASDPTVLWQLLREFAVGDSSPKQIAAVEDCRWKVEFIENLVANGATYIGYNNLDLGLELSKRGGDAYVFSFSSLAKQDEQSWKANEALLLELINEPDRKSFIAIVDCDATSTKLEKTHISHFQNGKEASSDLLEERQFLADKSFARYTQRGLETHDIQKPLKRRFVKVICPGPNCDKNEICEWLCSQCTAPIEFGYSDQYFYCDCGRNNYRNYDFKCKSPLHGPGFEKHDKDVLLSLLRSLDRSNYQNILILGETGVGKSTFINAFVNYLTFETLDEAKVHEELNWVIPCSFSTHVMDRTGPGGDIVETEVRVGSRPDEHDGSKGESATQQTTVYPVTIGSSTIRLIDTPGIGDTRGIAYDRKNMADILRTLSSYDELHGILILLKSNCARLTIGFIYCLKELLKHLHRSAAKNMVFGFTNTRIANYTPGDTYGPLKKLLSEHSDVGLSLNAHTVFCFDSESFRYLAAFKMGVFMDNEEDFRRSWQHSRNEALRLVKHFTSQPPHAVNSTMSLNGARELISELTKPMAEISQLIRTNIALCEDRMKELSTTRLTGDKLRKSLRFKKVHLHTETLAKPRTVCCNNACVEYKDDGNGEGKKIAIYKTHCHPVCYLTDVKPNIIAHPGIRYCAAFKGSEFCKGYSCKHHWQQHQHVLYENREQTDTETDTEIEKQLKTHADDVTLKQTAIKELQDVTKEYECEHKQIQQAAAQFGIYLRKNSLAPINDATIAYIDFLIAAEKDKINAGGNKQKLRALEADRREYLETIKILTANMKSNANYRPLDEEGVDRLVKELYKLKHFGKNLKTVKNVITRAHQATYRERPYRVQRTATSYSRSLLGVFALQQPMWSYGSISYRPSHAPTTAVPNQTMILAPPKTTSEPEHKEPEPEKSKSFLRWWGIE